MRQARSSGPIRRNFCPSQTRFIRNIVDAAVAARASRFILISFPHVEENTTPESPAQGRLDARPKSIHGRTRLQAEKCLFDACRNRSLEPVVLRAGVIYGPNIRLIQAARRLMESRLCAVWRKPTWVHLLALPDFLRCVEIAINRDGVRGIYNICDDCPVLLQEFMDDLAAHWGFRKPRRLPAFCFSWAAGACELLASVLHTGTPLTRDMIRMGMTSVVADTSRMKQDLRCELQFPSFREGLSILGGVCR